MVPPSGNGLDEPMPRSEAMINLFETTTQSHPTLIHGILTLPNQVGDMEEQGALLWSELNNVSDQDDITRRLDCSPTKPSLRNNDEQVGLLDRLD